MVASLPSKQMARVRLPLAAPIYVEKEKVAYPVRITRRLSAVPVAQVRSYQILRVGRRWRQSYVRVMYPYDAALASVCRNALKLTSW